MGSLRSDSSKVELKTQVDGQIYLLSRDCERLVLHKKFMYISLCENGNTKLKTALQ